MNDLWPWLIFAGFIFLAWRLSIAKKNLSENRMAQGFEVSTSTPAEDSQSRYIRNALSYAKDQHQELEKRQREHAAWERSYGLAQVHELDKLGGVEFEEYLAGLFRKQGYVAELTPSTGDFGADLVLLKDDNRIAVQAKRYAGSVGVAAVQEALSGLAYYQCNAAWVVTTGTFTPNAIELAKKSNVRLYGRDELARVIAGMSEINRDAS